MNTRKLKIEQLDNKFNLLSPMKGITISDEGWIKTIRTSIGMSFSQFGKKLGITPQSAKAIETRESSGSITLKSLDEAARALDMKLIYAIVPIEGSLSDLIEQKAKEKASEIISRTSHNMLLEDQVNNSRRLKNEFEETVAELKREVPKYLWD